MIVHVFATKSNIGDWLSARGIQQHLLDSFQIKELYCDSPCVDDTVKFLSGLSANDFVIIGGGGC